MVEENNHSDVLVPHSQSDMKRVGFVILSASIPMFIAAWRFYFQGTTDQETHGAYAFSFGAILMIAVGAAIIVKAWRQA